MLTDKDEKNFFNRVSDDKLAVPMSPELFELITVQLSERDLASLSITSKEMLVKTSNIDIEAVMEQLQKIQPSFLQLWLSSEKNCFIFLLCSINIATTAGYYYGGQLGHWGAIFNSFIPSFFGSYSGSLASLFNICLGASIGGLGGTVIGSFLAGGLVGAIAGGREGAWSGIAATSVIPRLSINTAINLAKCELGLLYGYYSMLTDILSKPKIDVSFFNNSFRTTLNKIAMEASMATTCLAVFSTICKTSIKAKLSIEESEVLSMLKVTKK